MGQQKIHYAWWIMISCCSISLAVLGIIGNSIGIFFAPVCQELGFSRGALTFYLTIKQLVMVVSLPIAGKIFPRINIRLLLPAAIIIYASGFFVMANGTSLIDWYIAGVILGIGGGFLIYLPVPILINNWFRAKAGFAMGFALAFSGVGGAIFNPIGQYVITNYGWRLGYITLAICSVIIVMPFLLFVVRFKPSDIGLQPYGADHVPQGGSAHVLTGVSLATALKTPSFYLMFFTGALLALTCNFNAHIPGYLTSIGFPAMVAATVASTVMIGVTTGKIGLGIMNDKFGLKIASSFGLISGILSMIFMLMAQNSIALIYTGAFCYGISMAMLTVEPPLLLKAIFGQKEFSAIYSNVTIAQAIVGAAAISIFGLIFDLTQSFAVDLIIVGIAYCISLLFIVLALNLGKKIQTGTGTDSTSVL